jgi:hypothetical protein
MVVAGESTLDEAEERACWLIVARFWFARAVVDGVEDDALAFEVDDVEAGGGISGYTQSALRNRQDRQVGRTSSHLTFRVLQFLHPARDFL